MIEAEGGTAAPFVADVTGEQQARAMVDAAIGQFGRLDCLDNNVGIGGRGNVVEVAPEDWRRVMQVNVDSMFMASRHAIPAMKETAGGGAIVNVSSISALRPRGLTAYSTSKGAVIALTRAMAVHAVRFLLSAEARYITGQTLVVDGGATLVGPARAPE
jgi:NAD(P)-dependent dehydrogenase (short-subunit alcohol dehydrogenase family)